MTKLGPLPNVCTFYVLLLEHSHAYSFIYFLLCYKAKLSSCTDRMAGKA